MTAWPASADELIAAQRALATAHPDPWLPRDGLLTVGACVVLFPRGQCGRGARGDRAWAAAAVLRAQRGLAESTVVLLGQRVLAESIVVGEAAGPYIPGLLALREGPCLEAAVRALMVAPDVLLVDATGADHPRRAGLALQLGAVTGLPTVGVTHRPLLAQGPWPRDERGAHSPLSLDGARVGAWVRSRAGARPVAVHAGWRTTLEVAVDVVLACATGHRTPEPFRHARKLARIARASR